MARIARHEEENYVLVNEQTEEFFVRGWMNGPPEFNRKFSKAQMWEDMTIPKKAQKHLLDRGFRVGIHLLRIITVVDLSAELSVEEVREIESL